MDLKTARILGATIVLAAILLIVAAAYSLSKLLNPAESATPLTTGQVNIPVTEQVPTPVANVTPTAAPTALATSVPSTR